MSMFDDKATLARKRAWASRLKAGDEVAITSGYGFEGRDIRFMPVVKVTKQHGGTVYVGSMTFDLDGDMRGGRSQGYRKTHMEEITQDLRDEVEARKLRNDIVRGFERDRLNKLPLSALRLVATIMEQHHERSEK